MFSKEQNQNFRVKPNIPDRKYPQKEKKKSMNDLGTKLHHAITSSFFLLINFNADIPFTLRGHQGLSGRTTQCIQNINK